MSIISHCVMGLLRNRRIGHIGYYIYQGIAMHPYPCTRVSYVPMYIGRRRSYDGFNFFNLFRAIIYLYVSVKKNYELVRFSAPA